jgi:hypothetical protein
VPIRQEVLEIRPISHHAGSVWSSSTCSEQARRRSQPIARSVSTASEIVRMRFRELAVLPCSWRGARGVSIGGDQWHSGRHSARPAHVAQQRPPTRCGAGSSIASAAAALGGCLKKPSLQGQIGLMRAEGQWQVFRQDIRANSPATPRRLLLGFVAPRGVDAGI